MCQTILWDRQDQKLEVADNVRGRRDLLRERFSVGWAGKTGQSGVLQVEKKLLGR